MDDLNARIAETEAELKQSSRYPEGYAADAVRGALGAHVSRSVAATKVGEYAAAAYVDPEDVKTDLANAYIRLLAIEIASEEAARKARAALARDVKIVTAYATPNTTAKEG